MSSIPLYINTSKIQQVQQGQWTSDDVQLSLYPAITLPGKFQWELGVMRIDAWNSIHNVKAIFSNNVVRYYNGTVWRTVTFPDGNYEIADINTMIQNAMLTNGDYLNTDPNNSVYYINFVPNYATGYLTIEITNSYQLDLSVSTLYQMLGFTSTILTATQPVRRL